MEKGYHSTSDNIRGETRFLPRLNSISDISGFLAELCLHFDLSDRLRRLRICFLLYERPVSVVVRWFDSRFAGLNVSTWHVELGRMHQRLACILANKFGPAPLALPAKLPIRSLALLDVRAVPNRDERTQLDSCRVIVGVAAGCGRCARVRRFTHDDVHDARGCSLWFEQRRRGRQKTRGESEVSLLATTTRGDRGNYEGGGGCGSGEPKPFTIVASAVTGDAAAANLVLYSSWLY